MTVTHRSPAARRPGCIAASCLALLLSGCAQHSYMVLLENADGSTGKVMVETRGGHTLVDRAGSGASLSAAGPQAFTPDAQQVETDFGPALRALPPAPTTFLLYFETATARLTAESRAKLPRVLEQTRARPVPDISIIGHTDTVGSSTDNEALGRARASAVLMLLRSAGIDARDVTVTSHGERNLLVPTADNIDEPRNRRVEVTVR